MAKKTYDLEARTVSFDFDDGNPLVVVEYDKLSDDMKVHCGLHGISQKGGDSYASAKKVCEETGADPIEWSRAQCEGVRDQLMDDDWTVRTPGLGVSTDLSVAFEEVTGETLSPDLDADQKKALRAHPDIAAVLATIKAKRATAKAEAAAKKVGTGEDLTDYIAA